ncbi:hypothetical protein ACFSB1_07550 [Halopseudomonas phragmitis]|uniref:Uncharacterized protein n=1 Tax=Halopseudomonas phragmitis TaxID=1931241 RepID=A0A1V0B137_9GAMM|nr:hypothetical protein [Halopseudomonas phragmitis]AQZ93615.1 hypothetical protein BVH74_02050 [Halopseudomonas phragmitis]
MIGSALLLLSGCAGLLRVPGPEPECRGYLRELDRRVAAAGLHDGLGPPPAAYPYLRANRFLNSFEPELHQPELRRAWLDAGQALDQQARLRELAALPESSLHGLERPAGLPGHVLAVEQCAERLRRADRLDADDGPWPQAARALRIADDYRLWQRGVGLYPVTRWFIRAGVGRWQQRVRALFEADVAIVPPGLRYLPVLEPEAEQGRLYFTAAERDALGWPQLADEHWRLLFARFAPVIELDGAADHDRIGAPGLNPDGLPQVDTGLPSVYTYLSAVRFQSQTLVQLNYVWWFPERPEGDGFDLYAGRLDGLTLRLTLDAEATPLLVESMHNCGCYHQHYPLPGLQPKLRSTYAEPPLILPGPGPAETGLHLRLRQTSASHYVTHLTFAPLPDTGQVYQLRDYQELRQLAVSAGGPGSLFGRHGLVPGTERRERWLFWVSGVREPGAMRQAQRHATAFVGRRHFDDADLLERIYRRSSVVQSRP